METKTIHPNARCGYHWLHALNGEHHNNFAQPGKEAAGWLEEQKANPNILWARVIDLDTGEVLLAFDR